MLLTWIDWVMVVVVFCSAAISLSRGFVREVLSLAFWVLAVIVPWLYSESLAHKLDTVISTPSLRYLVAGIVLFLATLVTGAVISRLVGSLTRKIGLGGVDRALAVLFGVLRGGVVLVLLISAAGYTPVHQEDWWQQSAFVPYLQLLLDHAKAWIETFSDFLQ